MSVPGALFFLGDCHAVQGDGEIVGTGIETSYEVTVRLSVDKRGVNWPRGETERDIFTVGNARPLEQALQHATTEMVVWLHEEYGLDVHGRQPSARPGRALRHRQRLRPGLHGGLPSRQEVAAQAMSERIALGLIGCGFFAQNHLHSWQDLKPEGVDIVAVCDTDPARAKAAAEKFGVPHWYTDAREMFAKEKLGLVDIATTMGSHLPLVKLATESSRADDRAEAVRRGHRRRCGRWWTASEKAGVFLAVHENFRFQRPLRKVREVLASGAIGKPSWARISFRTGYDIYAGQPYLAKQQRFVLIDVGVHVLDVARALLGEVTHSTAELQKRNPTAIGEDTATMLLRHESGAVSVVECTYGSRRVPDSFPETLIEVEGERGAIVSRIGNIVEVTVDGEMTAYDEDPPVLPWAERPWHVAQESVLATCRHMLRSGAGPAARRKPAPPTISRPSHWSRRRTRRRARWCPPPVSSSADPAAEFVLDMGADDLVEVLLGPEAQRLCAFRVEIARPAVDDPDDCLVGLLADQRHGLVAGDAAQRLDLLADRSRQARAPRGCGASRAAMMSIVAACFRKPTAARGLANQWRTSRLTGSTASCPTSGSRRMLEKKPEAAAFGLPGRTTMVGQANADAVDKALARIVVEQQFADRLLRAVAGERGGEELVADGIGERRAEHGDRRGEDEPRLVGRLAALEADGFEQKARAVEIDAIALLEIGLCLARNDRSEMEDQVRALGDEVFCDAWCGDVRLQCSRPRP